MPPFVEGIDPKAQCGDPDSFRQISGIRFDPHQLFDGPGGLGSGPLPNSFDPGLELLAVRKIESFKKGSPDALHRPHQLIGAPTAGPGILEDPAVGGRAFKERQVQTVGCPGVEGHRAGIGDEEWAGEPLVAQGPSEGEKGLTEGGKPLFRGASGQRRRARAFRSWEREDSTAR